jgi:hypothetical protein
MKQFFPEGANMKPAMDIISLAGVFLFLSFIIRPRLSDVQKPSADSK